MWRILSPYNLVDPDNPVFQQEQRHLRWLKTPESLLKYNLIVLVGIPALIVLWWLTERIGLGFKYVPPDLENRLLIVVLVASAMVMIPSSFYIVISTIDRIHRQFHMGDCEALRMTVQRESDILAAKDAIAQLQAWPFVALEIGLRGTFVAFFILNSFYDLYQSTYNKSIFFQSISNPLNCCLWGLVLVVGFGFIFEPLLRMRVLIAWSTAIAFLVKSASLALLTGFGAVLVFHLTQIGLIGGLKAWVNNSDAGIEIVFVFIPLCVVATGAFYGFYIGIRRISNNFIRRKAFAPD